MASEYLKSGQSAAMFARQTGVTEASVKRWLKESGEKTGRGERRLLPVVVNGGEATGGEHVEVALADGTALRLAATVTPERLTLLVAAVRRTC